MIDYAGVAERQTRRTQNPLLATEWGFKSLHQHHKEKGSLETVPKNLFYFDISPGRTSDCDRMALPDPYNGYKSSHSRFTRLILYDNLYFSHLIYLTSLFSKYIPPKFINKEGCPNGQPCEFHMMIYIYRRYSLILKLFILSGSFVFPVSIFFEQLR